MTEKKRSESFLGKGFSEKFIREKASLMIYLIISLSFFIQIPMDAYAQSGQQACCEKTKSGDYCVYTSKSNCDADFKTNYAKCEQSSFCSNVCCVSSDNSCYPNTPSPICSSQNGRSFSDSSCSTVSGCSLGCCSIGNQFSFRSENECRKIADDIFGSSYNFNDIFKPAQNEIECLDLNLQEREGCCVDEGICSFGKKSSCEGKFNLNRKCSQINECKNECKPRNNKDCYDGSVYWFDSCGNREELVEQCNYEEGKLCGKENGNVICKDLACADTTKYEKWDYTGGPREHGESWCLYDGPTGNFTDRPGTTHYRASCLNGEEVIEPCLDFRKEICVQAKDRDEFSYSSCIRNQVYESPVNANFSSVAPGFKFWEQSNKNLDQCNKGKTSCTVVWMKKDRLHDFECKANCFCETQQFIDDANNYCKSLGDCGFSYNVLGEKGSGGFNIYWSEGGRGPKPNKLSQDYLNYLREYGIYGGMKFLEDEIQKSFSGSRSRPTSNFNQDVLIYGFLGYLANGIIVSLSLASGGLVFAGGATGTAAITSVLTGGVSALAGFGTSVAGTATSGAFSATYVASQATLANALAFEAAAATGAAAGTGGTAAATAVAEAAAIAQAAAAHAAAAAAGGAGAAATEGATTAGSAVAAGASAGPVGIIIALVVAIVILIVTVVMSIITGGGKVRTKTITIECNPWQAPLGGDNCEKCNDDPTKECTEYKCKSLGTTCELIETNDNEFKCVDSNPNDLISPKITPLVYESGYTIKKEKLGYRFNQEIEPLRKFTFGFKTNEAAKCKFAFNNSIKYDDMDYYFGNSFFKKDHNMSVALEGNKEFKYYVKCVDIVGNYNNADYLIKFKTDDGPDLTPPIILETSIKNNAIVANNINQLLLDLELNEPATCRYEKRDTIYDEMSTQSICNDEFSRIPTEYKCTAGFSGLKDGQNTYYFKCRDLANNTNSQPYIYNIMRSKPLSINSVEPKGNLFINDITLSISTSSGSENGKAVCKYRLGNTGSFNEFKETNSNRHLQSQINLRKGNYKYNIDCVDSVGNTNKTTIDFSVAVERKGDEIVNVYKDLSRVFVITDVAAGCEYDKGDFVLGTGNKMSGDRTTVHSADVEFNQIIIKCKDDQGKELKGIIVNI